MNFNLISPDGEGQKFNVKFQEPIVIPPNAKIGLNFAQFERNGHFDFLEDQEFTIDVANKTAENSRISYQLVPRLPMVSVDATEVYNGRPLNSIFPNTSIGLTENDKNSIKIVIPQGTYSFDGINKKINELIYEKGIGIKLPEKDDQFFGVGNVPTIKQNAMASLYNTQILPFFPQENEMILGWTNDLHLENGVPMKFSTQHLVNATNVEFDEGVSPNSYTPSQVSAGGEYESYAMGRHRLLHFGGIQKNISIQGEFIQVGKHSCLSAVLNQNVGSVVFNGKNFMGLYCLDYAGLTNETHTNENGGTAGANFNKDVHTTRTGTDGSGALTPNNSNCINSATILNSTTLGAGNEVPKCFFGVEVKDGLNDEEINIYASTSMLGNFRQEVILDMELILSVDISTLQGLPHNLNTGKLQVNIDFVEEVNSNDFGAVNPTYNIGANSVVVFPIVSLSKPAHLDKFVIFDGRNHRFNAINTSVGFSTHFFTSNRIPNPDSDSIATRGSDLPLCPIFAGTHTDNGWNNIVNIPYEPQIGTLNSGTDPLRPLHFLRTHTYDMGIGLLQDLFGLSHKNEDGGTLLTIPVFSPFAVDENLQKVFENQGNTNNASCIIVNSVPHTYRNDAFNIHINLPIKSFSNTKDKDRSGIRKNILAH